MVMEEIIAASLVGLINLIFLCFIAYIIKVSV